MKTLLERLNELYLKEEPLAQGRYGLAEFLIWAQKKLDSDPPIGVTPTVPGGGIHFRDGLVSVASQRSDSPRTNTGTVNATNDEENRRPRWVQTAVPVT